MKLVVHVAALRGQRRVKTGLASLRETRTAHLDTRHDVCVSDPSALYALLGALGGAVLGAGATVAVPLITGRHARRVQEQAREDAQREKQRAREEAEFARLMALRRTSREVLLLLDAGRQDAERGTLDTAAFSSALHAATREMRDAADALEIDGLRFKHTRSTPEYQGRRRPPAETVAMEEFTRSVNGMNRWLHEFCDQPSRPWPDRRGLREYYLSLEMARYSLIGVLSVRMEELRGGPADGYPREVRSRRPTEPSDLSRG